MIAVLVLTTSEHAADLAAALGPEVRLWPVPPGQVGMALAKAADIDATCVVIDLDLGEGLAEAAAALRARRPDLRIALLATGRSPGDADVAAVARVGVFDVASAPADLAEVLSHPTDYVRGSVWLGSPVAVGSSSSGTGPAASAPSASASGSPPASGPAAATHHRLVAAASKKGGVGKSTVAANLAAAAARMDVDVLYIDLDPDTWSSEELFGPLGQRGGLTAALRAPTAETVLTSCERRHGLHVLARGREDGLVVQPEREAVARLLEAARPLFTLVVCDTAPAQDNPARFAALRAADRVYLVVDQADPSAVRTAGEVYLLERELGSDLSRFALVANHHRPELGGMRELSAFYRQGGVDCPILACVPHEPARYGAARRRGRPVACDLDLGSADGAPWRLLAQDALGLQADVTGPVEPRRRALFARLLGRGGGVRGRGRIAAR